MFPSIEVTTKALNYLEQLRQHYPSQTYIDIIVVDPGELTSRIKLSFSQDADAAGYYYYPLKEKMTFRFLSKDAIYLEGLKIDLSESLGGAELKVYAPSLHKDRDLSHLDKIKIFFNHEILPYLKQHSGSADLVDLSEDGVLSLSFKGGCQGCSQATITLKHGIEEKIKKQFPQITSIKDITAHSEGVNPYCKEKIEC